MYLCVQNKLFSSCTISFLSFSNTKKKIQFFPFLEPLILVNLVHLFKGLMRLLLPQYTFCPNILLTIIFFMQFSLYFYLLLFSFLILSRQSSTMQFLHKTKLKKKFLNLSQTQIKFKEINGKSLNNYNY